MHAKVKHVMTHCEEIVTSFIYLNDLGMEPKICYLKITNKMSY